MKKIWGKRQEVGILALVMIATFIAARIYQTKSNLNTSSQQQPSHMISVNSAIAAGVDYTKYTKPPFNLPAPSGDSDVKYDDATIARANTLGGYVAKHQTYLQSKVSNKDFVDPFASVIYDVAIEGFAADPYGWNCNDSKDGNNVLDSNIGAINKGCAEYFNSGDWQANGLQVSQASGHFADDFKEVYGSTDASKVKEVLQRVMSAKNLTNPSTIPSWSAEDIQNKAGSPGAPDERQSPTADEATARQMLALSLMDPELGAVALAEEIAADMSDGDWVGRMRLWGYTDFQTWSNRAKYLADHYTGSVTVGTTGGGVGGGSFALSLVLKPKEKDSYVINMATAVANGGGGSSSPGNSSGTPGLGNYTFPLDPGAVTGIATEMAAYPGGYDFGGHREHAGLDIGAPIAGHTPVYSVADGDVIAARDACYEVSIGEQCRIDISNSGDNYISSYSHVDVSPSIKVGTHVTKGQQIAVVHYWTAYESMDHLHFEMLDKTRTDSLGVGYNINPRNYFPELQRWNPTGYGSTGQDVRNYTNSVGLSWDDDGKEYAETYKNHPPCLIDGCWAH